MSGGSRRRRSGRSELCNGLLHKFRLRKGLCEGAHVLEVARRKTAHVRERCVEITRQLVDDAGTQALFLLPVENVAADLPVQ